MITTFRAAAVAAGALAVTCFGLTQVARASDIELMSNVDKYTMPKTFIDQVGFEDGGEFGVWGGGTTGLTVPAMAANAAINGSLFQTFCMELTESISTHDNRTNNIATNGPHFIYQWTINTGAIGGGRGGQTVPAFDPLDTHTAYLYTQFYQGTLTGYDYGVQGVGSANRTHWALALQTAIWFFENELGTIGNGFSPNVLTLDADAQALITLANNAVSSGAWSGIGAVRVLNLTTFNESGGIVNSQDVLVMVPLPSAAWLGLGLMSAMGAVGIIRRRNRQALA